MLAFIGSVLAALFDAIATAWRGRQQDEDDASAHERAGAAEAANETQAVISEVADERSQLPAGPDDAGALSARLREKAKRRAAGGGG